MRVAAGPNAVHSEPARTLAASKAIPVIRLYIPSAVPRRSAGAASSGQQTLGRAHVQTPKEHADKDLPWSSSRRQHRVRRNQNPCGKRSVLVASRMLAICPARWLCGPWLRLSFMGLMMMPTFRSARRDQLGIVLFSHPR